MIYNKKRKTVGSKQCYKKNMAKKIAFDFDNFMQNIKYDKVPITK